jgi:hypothetical protein
VVVVVAVVEPRHDSSFPAEEEPIRREIEDAAVTAVADAAAFGVVAAVRTLYIPAAAA